MTVIFVFHFEQLILFDFFLARHVPCTSLKILVNLSGKSNLLSFNVSLWVAVLPFLERTTFFLYPIGLVVVLFPFCEFSDENIFPTFGFPVVYQYYFAIC